MSSERVTELYRRYGPTIYWRCLRLLGDAGAAEDATQETFVRVHRHLARAPDDNEAIAWIWLRDGLHEDRDLARRVIARADQRDRVVAWSRGSITSMVSSRTRSHACSGSRGGPL